MAGKNCALLKKPETKTKMCNIHCTLRSDNVDNDNDGGDSSDDGEDGNDDGEDSNDDSEDSNDDGEDSSDVTGKRNSS